MSHTHSQSYSHRPRPACPPARLPACLSLCSWLILSPYMMDEIDRGVIACRRIQYIQYISISMRTANIDRSRSGFTLQGRNSSPNLLVPRGAPQRNASVHSEHLWNMLQEGELFSEQIYQLLRYEERNLCSFKKSIDREKGRVVGQIEQLKKEMIHNVDDLKISVLAELDRVYKDYMEKYATLKGEIVQIKKMKEEIELDIDRRTTSFLPRYHSNDTGESSGSKGGLPNNAGIMRSLERNNFEIKKSQLLNYIAQLQREKVMPLHDLTRELTILTHYENGFFQPGEFHRICDGIIAQLKSHLRNVHERKFEFIREPESVCLKEEEPVLNGIYEEQPVQQGYEFRKPAPVSKLQDFKVMGVSQEQQSLAVEWAEEVTLSAQQPLRSMAEGIALCSLEVGRNLVAIGSNDGLICVYELLGGKQVACLRGHKASICRLSLVNFAGKKYLASGSDHGCSSIILWDTANWAMRMRIESHRAAVTSILDLQDNHSLISGSYDKTINVYNLHNQGRVIFNLPVNKSSVTALLLNANGSKLVSCGLDDSLNVWQVVRGSGRVVETLYLERIIQNNTMICSLTASVLQPDLILLGAKDGKIKLINIDRGEAYKTIQCCSPAVIELVAIERRSHPDFPLVVCWPCKEEALRVVNTENGKTSTHQTKGFIEFGCGIGPKGFFLNGGRSLGMLSQAKDRKEVSIFKIDII